MATRTVPLDRTLPHSKSAEMAVLGAMIFDARAVGQVVELVNGDAFYFDSHRQVFEAVVSLWEANESVDLVTLGDRLTQLGRLDAIGGLSYLAELSESVPTATHVVEYARIVKEKGLLRQVIDASQATMAEALEEGDEVENILDRAQSRIFEVMEPSASGGLIPLREMLHDSFEYIDQLHKSNRTVTGVPTGFTDLDEILTGLQPSDLIIIAARPSMGKTSFALNIAQHVGVHENKGVGVFSLEMSKQQLVMRMLSSEAHINLRDLQTGYFPDAVYPNLVQASGKLSNAPIYIDDSPSASVMDVRARARRLRAQGKLDLLVIDYLQLMQERGRVENRQQEISKISRSLKGLARELQIPIIALSQLSRATESREGSRPQLADLRESGAIEQDADVVLMLYREEYYLRLAGRRGGEPVEVPPDVAGMADIMIAKQRNGPTGVVHLSFNGREVRFDNLDAWHAGEEEGSET